MLPSLRDEVLLLREEMRLARADIARFEIVVTKIASTTATMNVRTHPTPTRPARP